VSRQEATFTRARRLPHSACATQTMRTLKDPTAQLQGTCAVCAVVGRRRTHLHQARLPYHPHPSPIPTSPRLLPSTTRQQHRLPIQTAQISTRSISRCLTCTTTAPSFRPTLHCAARILSTSRGRRATLLPTRAACVAVVGKQLRAQHHHPRSSQRCPHRQQRRRCLLHPAAPISQALAVARGRWSSTTI
jgi:hypothetical protein